MSNIAASSKILLSFSWDTMTWNTLNKAGKKTEENHYLHVMKKFLYSGQSFPTRKPWKQEPNHWATSSSKSFGGKKKSCRTCMPIRSSEAWWLWIRNITKTGEPHAKMIVLEQKLHLPTYRVTNEVMNPNAYSPICGCLMMATSLKACVFWFETQ